eukprot:CAMPEP_0113935930 /NCGR_PEP_ID=MMETSP1339-20121228/2957_1 /TAXON_ID=94617 /ORGANISM="Fibrocapsa japonica" /LENGTH=132 /DNA_ID=CAMNT_0000938233 /DNA_START=174 /DNA_END=572 /DNA_ORIENTATION=+ /assembly_acc=CAM_ASM_000762
MTQLNESLGSLNAAKLKFLEAKHALTEIPPNGEGRQIMVPLTGSLYVPGRLHEPNKVMVDIGTGYYAEKNSTQAKEFIDRKVKMISDNIDSLSSLITTKHKNADVVAYVMQQKLEQINANRNEFKSSQAQNA